MGSDNSRLSRGSLCGAVESHMKHKLQILLVILATTSLVGCGTYTKISELHNPAPAIESTPIVDRLVVPRAIESRPLGGRSRIGIAALTLIPLWPYAPQKFTPERFLGTVPFSGNYDFRQDLAVVVAKDLQTAGVAQVVTADRAASTGPAGDTYTLRLVLDEGIWHRNLTFYGMSIPGVFLCLILPCSYGSAELALTAELLDPTGTSLKSASFRAKKTIIEWVFAARFLPNLTEAFAEIAPDLRAFVADTIKKGNVK